VSICFCTLAIHQPYRDRARLLCNDLCQARWKVLTDKPDDFADLSVDAIEHRPTGPMAVDYLSHLPPTGEGRGAAAYHDKRFAIAAALKDFDTAIYVDADSRLMNCPPLPGFEAGVAVLPVVMKSVGDHLKVCGPWRLTFFSELARHLTGGTKILREARWCHEALIAVTKDGNELRFFEAWSVAAEFLQSRDVYSGEGGVIGLAAAVAGWRIDYETIIPLGNAVSHEGGGPKATRQ
jgi:hypothetical protein